MAQLKYKQKDIHLLQISILETVKQKELTYYTVTYEHGSDTTLLCTFGKCSALLSSWLYLKNICMHWEYQALKVKPTNEFVELQ